MAAAKRIKFTLNGKAVELSVRSDEKLLETLRQRCGITSVKSGCKPQGQCGCCLAIIDGKARVTCALPAERADGRSILTLEGVDERERELCADAFLAAAGLQCGFCIPGFALRAKHLTDNNPSPSRAEIARAIDGNLCRCTGYVKIIDAIELFARAKRGEATPELQQNGGVGAPLIRHQGRQTVLGARPFVDDIRRPGMLFGALVLSAHPRALVRGIDTTAAASAPGVVRVATAADIPGDRFVGLIEPDWPAMVAVGEEVRCVGDVLAVVAAESEHSARAAAALVEVDYERLEPVLDPLASLAPGAPQVNPKHDNQLSRSLIERGDVDAALAASAHVASGSWQTQRIEHLFLETESAVAEPLPDGRYHLYSQGQGVFDDRRQVAQLLDVAEEQIFVELVPSGGAFGGKEDLSVQAHAALMAQLTGRSVKVTLCREESIRRHPKRHPIKLDYTVGCDAEGHLTAVRAKMIGDTGAYASVGGKVLERAAGHGCGPYQVPNVEIEAIAAYTNNPPCGAMRGFGVNQAAFAIEACVDLLAEKVGLDGWEMRWRNALQLGDTFCTGQVLRKSVGIKKTLEAVKEAYYEAAARAAGAVGIACGIKNSGIGNGAAEWGRARLAVRDDGTIGLYQGFTEMGQGLMTVLKQIAAEVSGVDADRFDPHVDASFEVGCGQTTGSRGTLLAGRAVIAAAEALRAALDGGARLQDLAGKVFAGDILIDDTTELGAALPDEKVKTHTAFGYATQLCVLDGDGRVERVVAAHDVGRAINPELCRGQIEGAVHMGLGYALTEELPCEDGMPVTFDLRELGVLRARDMPQVEVILVEDAEPEGPFGAKGVGEIGLVPTAAAVAGALAKYDGTRHYRLPMKESPAARAMSVGRIRARKK